MISLWLRRSALLGVASCVAVAFAAPAEAKLKRPAKLRATPAAAGEVELRWRDRARGERRYELRWKQAGTDRIRKRRMRRNTSATGLSKLIPGARYAFQVRACRKRRCSKWSRPARGAPGSPPLAPAPVLAPSSSGGGGGGSSGGDSGGDLGGGDSGGASLESCAVFPPAAAGGASLPDQRAWNQDVSGSPADVSAAAGAFIASVSGDDIHPDFGSDGPTLYGIPYVVVPGSQPPVPIVWGNEGEDYGDESDPGPYPIPPDAPKESGSDEHVIVVDGDACILYELYNADFRNMPDDSWQASSGAVWDLYSAALRTEGWTSADAAGLPILPGLVRYDEVEAGSVDHAIRVTFSQTRAAYVYPATHEASSDCDANLPPMGMRLRLKASYDISGISGQSRPIAEALKRYGLIVADNGSDWFITGAADARWDNDDLNQLKTIPGSAFEVVESEAAPVGC